MKKTANTFLKVNTVFCAILCIVLIGIPGVIFSVKARKRLLEAKHKDDVLTLAILNIIFGTSFGVAAGIIMLCMNDKHFAVAMEVKNYEK